VWRSGMFARWAGIPLAVGFALYIPQYVAPQYLRVAHGFMIAVACLVIAQQLQRERVRPPVSAKSEISIRLAS
jgi:hypothetical protein